MRKVVSPVYTHTCQSRTQLRETLSHHDPKQTYSRSELMEFAQERILRKHEEQVNLELRENASISLVLVISSEKRI